MTLIQLINTIKQSSFTYEEIEALRSVLFDYNYDRQQKMKRLIEQQLTETINE